MLIFETSIQYKRNMTKFKDYYTDYRYTQFKRISLNSNVRLYKLKGSLALHLNSFNCTLYKFIMELCRRQCCNGLVSLTSIQSE